MYVCLCHGITDRQLRQAIRAEGLTTLEDIARHTGVGACCGCCQEQLVIILADERRPVLVDGVLQPEPMPLAAWVLA